MSSKNIVAIIPARGGSKGLPNKNIYPIFGKPLIEWTLEQAKISKYIDEIIVSTDDINIMNIAKKKGAIIIERPNNISGDEASSESALIHSIGVLNEKLNMKPDIVVFLQATSPLRKRHDIDDAIKTFINRGLDSLFSVTTPDDLTLWQEEKGEWKSINFDYQNRVRRQDMSTNYIENGSIYIFKPQILEKFNNRLGGKISTYKMDFWQTWELDTYEEIELIEFFLEKKNLDFNGTN